MLNVVNSVCLSPLSVDYMVAVQGCHGQGKISGKLNFFQVGEKSENSNDGQGN